MLTMQRDLLYRLTVSAPIVLSIVITFFTPLYRMFAHSLIDKSLKGKLTQEAISDRSWWCYFVHHQYILFAQLFFVLLQMIVVCSQYPALVIAGALVLAIFLLGALYSVMAIDLEQFKTKTILNTSIAWVYIGISIVLQLTLLLLINLTLR